MGLQGAGIIGKAVDGLLHNLKCLREQTGILVVPLERRASFSMATTEYVKSDKWKGFRTLLKNGVTTVTVSHEEILGQATKVAVMKEDNSGLWLTLDKWVAAHLEDALATRLEPAACDGSI